jgi:hypothetical protein
MDYMPQHLRGNVAVFFSVADSDFKKFLKELARSRALHKLRSISYSACCMPRERCVCIQASVTFSPLA